MPKTTAPQAAPAAPAGAAPAAGAAADESGWVKLCLKNEQTGGKQVCFVNYEALEPETSMVVGAVAVRSIEGDDKQYLIVRLTTAYSLVIQAGVQVKIDEGEAIPLRYAVCFPSSCEVQIELSKEMFDKMRNGKQMVVASMSDQQKARIFPVPLTSFSKSFDGPPVDNAQYEASRRAMMEKLRQRQLEIANKIGEEQKEECGRRSGSGRRYRRSGAQLRGRAADGACDTSINSTSRNCCTKELRTSRRVYCCPRFGLGSFG